MKNKELQGVYKKLQSVSKIVHREGDNTFSYAVKRNIDKVTSRIKEVNAKKAISMTKETDIYQKEVEKISEKYKLKDEKGEPIVKDGYFQFDFAEMEKEMDEINKSHVVAVEHIKKEQERATAIDEEESLIDFYKCKFSKLPALNADQMDIEFMLDMD